MRLFPAIQLQFKWLVPAFVIAVFFAFSLPAGMFSKPTSTVVYARGGELLSAVIADDGQWRFAGRDAVPHKFKIALLHFEDEHFFDHSGVYLPALFRAFYQNVRDGRVVSGGSTLTMQAVRLSRDNPPRTLWEKILEMVRALRLEWRFSKEEILNIYSSNAPFGGNVVGLDAASWRYFGRSPEQLSWAESATLAVLPNAPALIFPGKNQERLLQKRNRLLRKLFESGVLDESALQLSILEPLPQKPYPLPQVAQHVLHSLIKDYGKGKRFDTTIDFQLQLQANELVRLQHERMVPNLVYNAAALVVDVRTGEVLAYVGNTVDPKNTHHNQVDVVRAPRSTGSILKPFLYAAMLKDGLILPHTLLPDVPIQYDGFAPKNYSETFDGAVPASMALSRSLNVPAVHMLRDYGYPRFYHLLQKQGFRHFTKPSGHYGLSLILGGGEASLWDVTHAYASLARTVVRYAESGGKYYTGNERSQSLLLHVAPQEETEQLYPLLDAGSVWSTFRSLLEVNRPETELGWEVYNSYKPIAWKTGTSFGNRDAWAVGTTPEYVVGVWVGNANGQGRPMLTGVTSAAPLLFDLFSALPTRSWFSTPYDDMVKLSVCKTSGMRSGPNCEETDTMWVPKAGNKTSLCTHHRRVYTNAQQSLQLNLSCASQDEMHAFSWFVLPPVQAHYYKMHHAEYLELPPFAPGCETDDNQPIGLIYPRSDAKVYVPKNLTGSHEKVVLQASHHRQDATLYWHLDAQFLGETSTMHYMELEPMSGTHTLTLVDQQGHMLTRRLEFVSAP